MMNRVKQIEDYFDKILPNPKPELNYNKDYEFLIAVVLSAQTTDKSVNKVTSVLFKEYDSLEKLRDANIDDIKKIIRPIGTFNKKSQFIIDIAKYLLDNCDGVVPNDRKVLESISGVGRKTANVVLSVLFNYPAIAVDTHVFRVSNRIGLADGKNVLDVEKQLQKEISKDMWSLAHHLIIFHGRRCCSAKSPKCNNCIINQYCKYYKEMTEK